MRARITAVSTILVLPLVLTACGGTGVDSAREKFNDTVQTSLTEQGWPQSVIDCQKNAASALSDDDFTSINEESASDEVKAAFAADVAACFAAGTKGKGGGKGG